MSGVVGKVFKFFADLEFNPLTALISFALNLIISYVFAKKAKTPRPSIPATVREAAPARQYCFGRSRVGGAIIYIENVQPLRYPYLPGSGTKEGLPLDMVIALATHPIEQIEYILVYGKPIVLEYIPGSQRMKPAGNVTLEELEELDIKVNLAEQNSIQKRFQDHITVEGRLDGTSDAFPDLRYRYGTGVWLETSKGTGCALAWVSLTRDEDGSPWSQGVPNITFVIKGSNQVYDPRTNTTGYTANPALIASWLIQTFPTGIDSDLIDIEVLKSSADICDRMITRDAEDGSQIVEKQYECGGQVLSTQNILTVLTEDVAITMGGAVFYSRLGGWNIIAASYTTPVVEIKDADIQRTSVTIIPKVPWQDRFNTLRCLYRSAQREFLTTEAPQASSEVAIQDDGHVLESTVDLEYVTSAGVAGRVSQQLLKRARNEVVISFKMAGYEKPFELKPWDVVTFEYSLAPTLPLEYRVISWAMSVEGDGIDFDLTLREVTAEEYTYSTDYVSYAVPGNPNPGGNPMKLGEVIGVTIERAPTPPNSWAVRITYYIPRTPPGVHSVYIEWDGDSVVPGSVTKLRDQGKPGTGQPGTDFYRRSFGFNGITGPATTTFTFAYIGFSGDRGPDTIVTYPASPARKR